MATSDNSSSRLLAIGGAVFAIGVVLVLFIVRSGNDEPATQPVAQESTAPSDTTAPAPAATDPPLTASLRIPRPLEVPEGTEAVAIRVDFVRGVAALPEPGDHVSLYRLPPADKAAPNQPPARDSYAASAPNAELLLADVEVLAITGPVPAAADGSPVLIVAVPIKRVPSILPVALAGEVWFTLLPEAAA